MPLSPAGKLGVASVMGLIFGIALQKGRVFEPAVIRQQMLLESFVMVKMFLSAVVTGQLALVLLSKLQPAPVLRAKAAFDGCLTSKSVTSSAIGGAILGFGMTLAGACPGMVLVQVGTGVPNALYTLAGCFAGVFVWSAFEQQLMRACGKAASGPHRLDERLKAPYAVTAVGMSLGLIGLISFIESRRPWNLEVPHITFGGSFLQAQAWSPEAAGIVVGLLQVPAVLFLDDTLGSATSYTTLCSQWLRVAPGMEPNLGSLKKYQSGVGNWWQVAYVGAAVAGGALSAELAGGLAAVVPGVSKEAAFLGGIIMIVGARMAGGCTSGHGLSGMSLLARMSFVAVPAMFVGGMAAAFVFRAVGRI